MPISSRRSFLQGTAMTVLAMRIITEPMLAGAGEKAYPQGSVIIDQNENPLGPCQAAREAIAAIAASRRTLFALSHGRADRCLCS